MQILARKLFKDEIKPLSEEITEKKKDLDK